MDETQVLAPPDSFFSRLLGRLRHERAAAQGSSGVTGERAVAGALPLEGLAALIANATPTAVVVALFTVAVALRSVMAARLLVVAFALVVPGVVVLSAARFRPREVSVRIAAAVGTSVLVLVLLGLGYSEVLPQLGVHRPLSAWSLTGGVDVVTLGALAIQVHRREPLEYLGLSTRPNLRQLAVVAMLALLVLAAVAGAERVNAGRGGAVDLAVLLTTAVLLAAVLLAAPRLPPWSLGASLYAASSSTLLMTSMRSNFPFGWDIQSEYHVFAATLAAGAWHVPTHGNAYAAMLSITILPAVLVTISHMSGIYLFKAMYPLVFSLFPVLVYVISARWFASRAAFIGAAVVIGQGFYAADITGLARQEIGLLYFALAVAIAFDERLGRRARQVAFVLCGLAMAITHYSTAYFALSAFIFGYVAYGLIRLVRRRSRPRPRPIVTLPVLAMCVGAVLVWNVSITHSAENVGNLVSSIEQDGLQILPGQHGESLITRFIQAGAGPNVTAPRFVQQTESYYATNDPWIRPYPRELVAQYPVKAATLPLQPRKVPAVLATVTNKLTTATNELLLLLIAIGTLALLWRERRDGQGNRLELASVAIGTLVLLGLLRTSATLGALYNAPRGQVQGAVALSVGLALVCSWVFERRGRLAFVRVGTSLLAAFAVAFLLFSYSGLAADVLSGSASDLLANSGEAYQRFYVTEADHATAVWLVRHYPPGGVVFADTYGALDLDAVANLHGLEETLIPGVIDKGAYVYASATNVVDGTARSGVSNEGLLYRFPARFFGRVKNLVFSTATTQVYR